MTQARFKIVFNGELMPDISLETAKENLARLFKSDHTRINSLFNGATVDIKRDLSENEADQYLKALQGAGAKVRKEPDLAASLSLVETDDHREEGSEPAGNAQMTCPKCAHPQAKAGSRKTRRKWLVRAPHPTPRPKRRWQKPCLSSAN